MSELRVGVIGLGYWGEKLARVFAALPGVRVVAGCDLDPHRAAALPPSADFVGDVASLAERADTDAVLVATPPATHFAVARQVLEAGKHCWVEKPLATNSTEARRLVEAAHRKRRILFVDETFLYDPLLKIAKERIDAGSLGRLYHLSFERLGMGRIRRDSDVWWNSAPHDLAILRHLVPGPVESVRVESFSYLQPGVADMAVATAVLAGGISAHVYVSWLSPAKTAEVVVVGERGMLRYEGRFGARRLTRYEYAVADPAAVRGNLVPVSRFETCETIEGGDEEPLALAAAAFVESVRTGISAPSAGEYSLRAVELLEAAGTTR